MDELTRRILAREQDRTEHGSYIFKRICGCGRVSETEISQIEFDSELVRTVKKYVIEGRTLTYQMQHCFGHDNSDEDKEE